MFAAVCYGKMKGSYELIRYECDGYGYYSMTLNRRKKPKAAAALLLKLSHMTKTVVAADNVDIPDDCGLKKFVDTGYRDLIYRNIVLHLLGSQTPRQVGVVDISGDAACLLSPVIAKSRLCIVLTDHPEAYKKINDECAAGIGARAVVTDDRTALYDCPLVFAPRGVPAGVATGSFAVIVGTGNYTFREDDVPILFPDEMRPACLSPFRFSAALYELCGVKKAGIILPQRICCGNYVFPLDDLCRILDGADAAQAKK